MARPKQVDDSIIIGLIKRYYQDECSSDPRKLKYEDVTKFINSNGYPEYAATSLRRNKAARTYIDSLKERTQKAIISTVTAYKTLDVDDFIRNNRGIGDLKRSLTELDAYYMSVADSASQIFNEHNGLVAKYEETKAKLHESNIELQKMKEALNELRHENAAMKKENKALESVINTYVYPEIANELLAKERVKLKTTGCIDTERLNMQVITPETPVNAAKSGSNVIKGLFEGLED